jgi:hypothetical protein
MYANNLIAVGSVHGFMSHTTWGGERAQRLLSMPAFQVTQVNGFAPLSILGKGRVSKRHARGQNRFSKYRRNVPYTFHAC